MVFPSENQCQKYVIEFSLNFFTITFYVCHWRKNFFFLILYAKKISNLISVTFIFQNDPLSIFVFLISAIWNGGNEPPLWDMSACDKFDHFSFIFFNPACHKQTCVRERGFIPAVSNGGNEKNDKKTNKNRKWVKFGFFWYTESGNFFLEETNLKYLLYLQYFFLWSRFFLCLIYTCKFKHYWKNNTSYFILRRMIR